MKAALLETASGMLRFYRGLFALAMITIAAAAAAQTPAPPEPPLLGSTLSADLLRDLPTGNSAFTVLETIQPETIGSRLSLGGADVANAPLFGGFLNSWTQTQYRIGDVAITDPLAGGTPLLLPVLPLWERITTSTAAMGVDDHASGLSMTLEPPRPGATWLRTVEGSWSAPALVATGGGAVPAVDRVRQWQDANVMVSGPLTDRIGLVAAGSWRGLSHIVAPSVSAISDGVASGFAHLVFAASSRDEIRALGWVQRTTTDAFSDTGVHLQSTWERRDPANMAWRVFGGYTASSRTSPAASTLTVDSLTSDPVSDLIASNDVTARRWVAGARLTPKAARHLLPTAGVDVESAEVRLAPATIAQIAEMLNGAPARMWTVHAGSGPDVRHLTTFAAFGNERVIYRGLTFDAGLRLEKVSGAANGSTNAIDWTTWLPRAMARWQVTDTGGLALVASYRRTAYQLPLNVLAVGDPAAPVADVSVWNGNAIGPPIARVGPGTGGDATFTQIDPNLQRPTTDELVLAVQARPRRGLELQLARITKREQPLLGFVDTGVTASSYSTLTVPDPSFIPGSPVGAPQVSVYNRPAGDYGRDRYLLTNQGGDPARFWALEATVRASTDRFTLLFGGALTEATGPAAAGGFLPTENDQDVLGNAFVDPNAATAARGQLFQDRSHVVKIAGVYRFPWEVHLGAVLRYQDGQPFSRLVVASDLTQGPIAVRSYANGGSAFTYTATLDVRLQKTFIAGGSRVAAVLDVYNLTNLDNEVTEYVVTGPGFRAPTALQPPRTALLGVRVTF